jgi:tetratricopeptide (TPR) repeat protein
MKTAHEHYKKGNQLRASGCDTEALSEYESAVQLQPDFLIAKKCADFLRAHIEKKCLSFGRLYESEGNVEEAGSEYKRALETNPRSLQGHKHLALLYMRAGDHTNAKKHINAALGINPSQSILYFYLGQLFDHEEKHTEAIEAYSRAQECGSSQSKESARQKGLSKRLAALYQNTPGRVPAPEIGLDIAAVYLEKNMPEAAIRVLGRVIRQHRQAQGLIYTLANIHFTRSEFTKAQRYYEKCLSLKKGTIAREEIFYRIGLCYLQLKKRSPAREAFEQCLCLSPTSRTALRAKAELATLEKSGQLSLF